MRARLRVCCCIAGGGVDVGAPMDVLEVPHRDRSQLRSVTQECPGFSPSPDSPGYLGEFTGPRFTMSRLSDFAAVGIFYRLHA